MTPERRYSYGPHESVRRSESYGGYNGVQQVLRRRRPHRRKPHPTKVQLTPDSDRVKAIDTRARQVQEKGNQK